MRRVIDFDQGWKLIENVGMTTLNRKLDQVPDSYFTSRKNYMNLYKIVYNMCTQHKPSNFSTRLYAKYQESVEDYVSSKVVPSLGGKNGMPMLNELVHRWENHKIMVRLLARFFYCKRYFIGRKSLPPLFYFGIGCFRSSLSSNLVLSVPDDAWDAVTRAIDQEREGNRTARAFPKNYLVCFEEIGMGLMDYYQCFEAQMMKCTSAYYSKKASSWILEYSYSDYLLKAEECLKREEDIGCHYLQPSSVPKLIEKVGYELLGVYATELLENEHTGWRALLRDDKVEDLLRMYLLFYKVPGGPERIGAIFKQHVIAEGMTLFKQAENALTNKKLSLMEVIDFHYKHMHYVWDRFAHAISDPLYNAIREAFEVFCNEFEPNRSSAELLATFCSDDILKKVGSGNFSDESIDERLEKLVTCVADVDLFIEFYRRKLGRRLLFDKFINKDHERIVLSKLKHQFGSQFTWKMEGMLKDLTLAKQNQTEFNEFLSSNPHSKPDIDFNINVLTCAFWPTYNSLDLKLPPEMAKCVESYQDFYQAKTKGRKLTWNYSLGTCYIHGKFDAKTIELVVTPYQAATLLLFNNSDRLSYSQIKTQLNLGDDDDVVRLLHSLSCGKYQILKKDPSTARISSTDNFEFNSMFTDTKERIKVPLPLVIDKKVIEDVVEDRRYALDASIMRIMKSHKVLNQESLVMECTKQMSHIFKPDTKAIKKRIEGLICREYLERDEDDQSMLKYLP